MQVLELAHMAISRRLQEAGVLGGPSVYLSPEERDGLIFEEACRHLRLAGGNCDMVLRAFREDPDASGHLSMFLDQLPSASTAVDVFFKAGRFSCPSLSHQHTSLHA
jgi:hypothetical protein